MILQHPLWCWRGNAAAPHPLAPPAPIVVLEGGRGRAGHKVWKTHDPVLKNTKCGGISTPPEPACAGWYPPRRVGYLYTASSPGGLGRCCTTEQTRRKRYDISQGGKRYREQQWGEQGWFEGWGGGPWGGGGGRTFFSGCWARYPRGSHGMMFLRGRGAGWQIRAKAFSCAMGF